MICPKCQAYMLYHPDPTLRGWRKCPTCAFCCQLEREQQKALELRNDSVKEPTAETKKALDIK